MLRSILRYPRARPSPNRKVLSDYNTNPGRFPEMLPDYNTNPGSFSRQCFRITVHILEILQMIREHFPGKSPNLYCDPQAFLRLHFGAPSILRYPRARPGPNREMLSDYNTNSGPFSGKCFRITVQIIFLQMIRKHFPEKSPEFVL